MTSGNFHSVYVNQIKTVRADRQRKELKDIDVLADSIRRLGLIHPLLITRDHDLVAGERRLAAVEFLGWDKVPCQYTDEIDPINYYAMELEENIKRLDLTWQEQCAAVTEYHALRKDQERGWTQEKTARALGLQQPVIAKYLGIQEEVQRGNTKIMEQPLLSTAVSIVARSNERRDLEALRGLDEHRATEKGPDSILNTSFLEWAPTYSGPKFNFIHCDFPYGINTDERQQGDAVQVQGGYDDSPEVYWALLKCLCDHLDQFCSESAHLMFWFSMTYYTDTIDYITRNTDFILDPFPLIWLKSDNKGLLPDPMRGPRRIYETALFGARGDRKIVSSISNGYAAPTDRSQHLSIKPEPVLRNFFRMFVDENSIVLDPTCGSGSALRAAESLGAPHVLGLERSEEFAQRATLLLETARRLRKAADAV